jgi:hypothetical protein
MDKKIISSEKEMFFDTCSKCGTEITGFSEKQVNQRMKIHLSGCKGKIFGGKE